MTFPAILDATGSPLSGSLALIAGIVLAYMGVSMFNVSIVCCLVVFIAEFVNKML